MLFDGKAFGEEMVGVVRGFVEQALAPLIAENAALAARLATVETRDVAAELRPEIEAVARAVAALPPPPAAPDLTGFVTRAYLVEVRDAILTEMESVDLSGFATKADLAGLVSIDELRAALPDDPDLSGFATRDDLAEVRSAIPALPEAPDLTGFATKADLEASRQPAPDLSGFLEKGEGEEIRGLLVRQTAEIRAEIHDAIAAVELKEGPQGKLPIARAWDDDVTYAGEVRTHAGALWQASRDTGKAPGGADWLCLVPKAEDGAPAPRFRIRGTWDERASNYTELDIVAVNGASFVARCDNPGPCPGDGWQLWAKQGKPGQPGEKVVRTDPGPRPVSFVVDEDQVALTLALDDGTRLTADLYPLLAQVAK